MYCPKCGKEIPDYSRFCRYCRFELPADNGAKAEQPENQEQPAKGKQPAKVMLPERRKDLQEPQKPQKSKKDFEKVLIAILSGFLAVLLAVVGILFYLQTPQAKLKRQLSLGNRYLAEQNYDGAVTAFGKALGIEPKNQIATEGIITAYLGVADTARDNEKKISAYENILKYDDGNETAYENLSTAYLEQGDAEAAGKVLARAAEKVKSSAAQTWMVKLKKEAQAVSESASELTKNVPAETKTDETQTAETAQSAGTQQAAETAQTAPAKPEVSEEQMKKILETNGNESARTVLYGDFDQDGTREMIGLFFGDWTQNRKCFLTIKATDGTNCWDLYAEPDIYMLMNAEMFQSDQGNDHLIVVNKDERNAAECFSTWVYRYSAQKLVTLFYSENGYITNDNNKLLYTDDQADMNPDGSLYRVETKYELLYRDGKIEKREIQ